MTTVYGVTKFGARLQIAKQLRGQKKNTFHFDLCFDDNFCYFLN